MATKSIVFYLFIGLATCFFAYPSQMNLYAQTTTDIAKSSFESTVLIVSEDKNGQPLGIGSGFFVADNLIATNAHVIEGASRGYAKLINSEVKMNIEGLVAINSEQDLALIKVIENAPAVDLGDSDELEVGQTIFAVGNPKGLEGTFSSGIISALRKFDDGTLIQITAPISPGSSGGPIINQQGKIIGVSVATYRGGQNLNFGIPVNRLKELLLKDRSLVLPLPSITPKKTKKQAEIGSKLTDGVEAHSMTWDRAALFNTRVGFDFSISNKLRTSISNISVLIIFKDKKGRPLDAMAITYEKAIAPGLAKRLSSNLNDGNIKLLTSKDEASMMPFESQIEFRILDFRIDPL